MLAKSHVLQIIANDSDATVWKSCTIVDGVFSCAPSVGSPNPSIVVVQTYSDVQTSRAVDLMVTKHDHIGETRGKVGPTVSIRTKHAGCVERIG